MPPLDRPCRLPCRALHIVLLWLVLCAAAAHAAQPADAPPPVQQRRILVLYSLGADSASAWQSLVRKGLDQELASNNLSHTLAVFEERLDAVRIGDGQAMAAMEPYLRAKYDGIRFDQVITENYEAARFLSERPGLFAGVPRVYLNHGRHDWRPADGVGYDIETAPEQLIGIIARMAPRVRHVVVVGDGTERLQTLLEQARRSAARYQDRLTFAFWDQLRFDQLYSQAGALDTGSAILLLPAYHDSSGARSRPIDVARRLAAVARVPIFTSLESMVVPGVVGGYVISGERVGRAIGQILRGVEPDIAGTAGYIFDYPTVQRHGLANIPSDAQWRGRPQSVWRRYRWQIAAGATLIVLQGALISALVLALRGRRRSLCALDDERRQLELRVSRRTLELQAANAKLEQLASTDPLTGIGNRRKMTERINLELERSRRSGQPLSLLMVDIDHFKHVNDGYGHDAGDRVIVAVAQQLAGGMRSIDLASRIGGEEFVLLMPETDIDVARGAAERLRAQVGALRVTCDDGRPIALTISIGVTTIATDGAPDTASSLLLRADRALYRAKHAGRDRVMCA